MDEQAGRVARRLQVALGLQRSGIRMMRQNLRRRHPEASPDDIDELLRRWMRERPPDSAGVSSRRFTD